MVHQQEARDVTFVDAGGNKDGFLLTCICTSKRHVAPAARERVSSVHVAFTRVSSTTDVMCDDDLGLGDVGRTVHVRPPVRSNRRWSSITTCSATAWLASTQLGSPVNSLDHNVALPSPVSSDTSNAPILGDAFAFSNTTSRPGKACCKRARSTSKRGR